LNINGQLLDLKQILLKTFINRVYILNIMTNKTYDEGKQMVEAIYNTKLKLINLLSVSLRTEQEMEEIESNMFALVATQRNDSNGKYVYSNSEVRKAETKKRLTINERFNELIRQKYEVIDTIELLKAEIARKEQFLSLLKIFGDKE